MEAGTINVFEHEFRKISEAKKLAEQVAKEMEWDLVVIWNQYKGRYTVHKRNDNDYDRRGIVAEVDGRW